MVLVDVIYLGIDISKAYFDVAILQGQKPPRRKFPNNEKGFAQLLAWLRNRKVTQAHVCMESTSTYGDELALQLHEHGQVVSVINPALLKGFAPQGLARNKTDPLDALVIAHYCQTHKPKAWIPPAPEIRELQGLTRRLATLMESRQQEVNRSQVPGIVKAVKRSIRSLIKHLDAQIADLERQIKDHIGRHPDLRHKAKLLESIPGIGLKTAARTLAEIPDVEHFDNAKQVAAYAGLTPALRQSGSSVRGRSHISRVGNAHIRAALYLPAMVAMRCNPIMQSFAKRLLATGKAKKLVIVAIMRKLLQMMYGVLKNDCLFDPACQPANA
jgi:transposase